MGSSAVISPCGLYRYRLERDAPVELLAGTGPTTAIIMVNPSTADATENDHTIRKLLGFQHAKGWGKLIVGNIFAYRSKDVKRLATVDDPVGRPANWTHLAQILGDADQIIVAWGPISKQPKLLRDEWRNIPHLASQWGKPLFSIGAPAKDGHPRHPLMLAYAEPIQLWNPPHAE